jgi:hypothetical protein
LIFSASTEDKAFEKSLEREQDAFERLIHHKQTMSPPVLSNEGTPRVPWVVEVNGSNDTTIQYEPMAKEDFTFLLRRLSKKEIDEMQNRTIEVGMKVDAQGQFMVSIFDEKDPEQVRKRERFQKLSDDKNAVGELSYITDLVLAESGSSMEQFLLFGTFIGLFVLYIAVKMAFNDPILVQEEGVLL